jgi:hypothetical protein
MVKFLSDNQEEELYYLEVDYSSKTGPLPTQTEFMIIGQY